MSKEPTPRMDPAWIRGMTQRRMSRRDLFRYAGAGAGALGLSSILAACGVSGEAQTTGPTAGAEGSAEWWADMKAKGPGDHLNFTNWPAYIDRDFSVDGPGSRPSLYAFTKATGIDVTYRADINDERGVLRGDPSGARERAGHRPRHHRDVELPGAERDDRARVPDRARPGAAARTSTRTSARTSTTPPTTRATSTRWRGSRGSPASATTRSTSTARSRASTTCSNPKYAGHVGDVQQRRGLDAGCSAMIQLGDHTRDLDAGGLAEGGRLPPAGSTTRAASAWLDGPGVPDRDRERGPVGHDGLVRATS